MDDNYCIKCGKVKQLIPYHVLPVQWYHGGGKIVFLCKGCINLLDKKYPIPPWVLSTNECEKRLGKFIVFDDTSLY